MQIVGKSWLHWVTLLLLVACGPPPPPPADPKTRVLLIGIDGAAWDKIIPLLQAGELPHLEALVRRGYSASLTTMAPAMSPVIWTTIATGKIPSVHGIIGFLGEEEVAGERYPVTSNMRHSAAVWEMLGRAGVPVGVVGWWVTWPAEPVNGWMVSPYAAPGQTTWKGTLYADGRQQQTWPPEYIQELAPEIETGVAAAGLVFARLFPVPGGMELPDYLQAYLKDTQWVHVSDTIFRDVGVKLLREKQPRFLAVYMGGVDVVGHRFWRFVHPGAGGWESSQEEQEVFGPSLNNIYGWVDGAVGRLVAAAPEGTTILVVSDHGMQTAPVKATPPTAWNLFPQEISGGHIFGPDGIFILSGPGAARNFDPGWWNGGRDLPRLGTPSRPAVLDITATILHLFGLPLGQDMEGRVLKSVLESGLANRKPSFWATWDDPDRPLEATPRRSPRLQEVKRRLEGLGYIGN